MSNELATLDTFDTTPPAKIVESFDSTPYVAFFSAKANKAADTIAKLGTAPTAGEPLLFRPDGTIERLAPLRFLCTPAYYQFFAVIDDSNKVLQAAERKLSADHKEHVLALLAVFTSRGVEFARCTFRTAKCGAIRTVIKEVEAAAGPEWAARSADHKAATEAVSKAWMRVVGTVSIAAKKAKTAPFRPYEEATATVAPVSGGQYQAVAAALTAEGAGEKFAAVLKAHNSNVAEVKGKLA